MQQRPPLLTINSYPSRLQRNTSYNPPLSPLTPPPRLHLRTLLPSPPISPYLVKPPPPVPYAWIWRCHICHSVYRLGVTRRCLEDGHYFCSLPTPPTTPASPSPTTPPSPGNQVPRRKKKRRKPPRGCRAEFDYAGWESYNIWRRETSDQKARMYANRNPQYMTPLKMGKDCYRDCDFPSECQTYASQAYSAEARRKSEPELIFPWSPVVNDEMRRVPREEDEDSQLLTELAATTPPCVSPVHSSNAYAEMSGTGVLANAQERRRSLEAEKRGLEHEAQFVISPITSLTSEGEANQEEEDDEGIVREFIRVKKRKSIAKIEQLTGLKMNEVQYGKMVGEEVSEIFDTSTSVRDGHTGRRPSLDYESSPTSPLKMFYTADSSDDEDERLSWKEVKYGV